MCNTQRRWLDETLYFLVPAENERSERLKITSCLCFNVACSYGLVTIFSVKTELHLKQWNLLGRMISKQVFPSIVPCLIFLDGEKP